MLQHATSSQSIVFHQPQTPSPTPGVAPGTARDQYSGTQPKYEYKYEVSDHETGDKKSHWESREGDRVRGAYTLYEPDGALRTVEYTADAVHGFNAVVRRNEPNSHQHRRPYDSGLSHSSSANSIDGYDSPSRISGYIPTERSNFSSGGRLSDRLRSESNQNAEIGFSISHVTGPKRHGDVPLNNY